MRKIIAISAIIAIVVSLTRDTITNALISFFLAGVVPGTDIAVPFWAMMAVYCLGITALVTLYYESAALFVKSHRSKNSEKSQLPKRRYTSI